MNDKTLALVTEKLDDEVKQTGRSPDASPASSITGPVYIRAVAHTLRNPLQSIQGFADLLEPGLPPAKMVKYLTILRRDIARLTASVDDLSLLSELGAGALVLDQSLFSGASVEAILQELTDSLMLERPGCSIELDRGEGELPPVHMDEVHFRRILWTLLQNAAEPANAQARPVSVAIKPYWDWVFGPQLAFLVRDDRHRIPARHQVEMFDPLAKLPQTLRRRPFGLGLYVAREIVWLMGGDLWLQTPTKCRPRLEIAKSRGNVFGLSVPVALVEVDE